MKSRQPLIAISCGVGRNLPKHRFLYKKAVEDAGGLACFVSAGTRNRYLFDCYDGFIIPGGDDLAPSFYKEKCQFQQSFEASERTFFEMSLLRSATKLRKPTLGICYGMQLMNVFFGGTLYQDISSQIQGSLNHTRGRHEIRIIRNPYLEPRNTEVNSRHHQAIKDVGKRISTIAYSPDGIIEAFYLEDYCFMLGVQWHPERLRTTLLSTQIFSKFIQACGVKQLS